MAEMIGILSRNPFPNFTENTFNFIDLGGTATLRRILLEREAAYAEPSPCNRHDPLL
jgi:hypothetical protein